MSLGYNIDYNIKLIILHRPFIVVISLCYRYYDKKKIEKKKSNGSVILFKKYIILSLKLSVATYYFLLRNVLKNMYFYLLNRDGLKQILYI